MMPLYVYALTATDAAPLDMNGHIIEFVPVGGVFAAVTTIATMPALSEEALRFQHEVVEAVAARVTAILPARFGSLVDRAELERLVALRRDAIAEALVLVGGCEQMTVRVFGEAETSTPPAASPTSGTEYLRQRADAENAIPVAARPLADAVRALVRAERIVRGERGVVVTLYHLVARGTSGKYQQALEPLRATWPGPGFIVSGPWPPFAFAPELWA